MLAKKNKINETFFMDTNNIGLSCLYSVCNYYNVYISDFFKKQLEQLPSTYFTFSNIYKIATKLGFEVDAYEIDNIENLSSLEKPLILELTNNTGDITFVVYYETLKGCHLVGEPYKRLYYILDEELTNNAQSLKILTFKENSNLYTKKRLQSDFIYWIFKVLFEESLLSKIILLLSIFSNVFCSISIFYTLDIICNIKEERYLPNVTINFTLIFLYFTSSFLVYLRCYFSERHFFLLKISLMNSIISDVNDNSSFNFDNFINNKHSIWKYVSNITLVLSAILSINVFIYLNDNVLGLLFTVLIVYIIYFSALKLKSIIFKNQDLSVSNDNNIIQKFLRSISIIKAYSNTLSLRFHFRKYLYDSALKKYLHQRDVINQYYFSVLILFLFFLTVLLIRPNFPSVNTQIFVSIIFLYVFLLYLIFQINLFELLTAYYANIYKTYSNIGVKEVSNKKKNIAEENLLFERNITKLSFQLVSFYINNKTPLFTDISFSVERGNVLQICGKIGSGKTTILEIITRKISSYTGKVIVECSDHKYNNFIYDLSDLRMEDWVDRISYISHHGFIIDGDIIENICLGNSLQYEEEVIKFCKEYKFHDYFMSFPDNYKTLLNSKSPLVSHNQQVLINLARALFKRPQLLVVDNISIFINSDLSNFFINLIKKTKSGCAVLVVSDIPFINSVIDKTYILDDKKLIFYK